MTSGGTTEHEKTIYEKMREASKRVLENVDL
jgi:hypothetical protein